MAYSYVTCGVGIESAQRDAFAGLMQLWGDSLACYMPSSVLTWFWYVVLARDATHSHASCSCVRWPIHTRHYSFTRDTVHWYVVLATSSRDVTHSNASCSCEMTHLLVTWPIHVRHGWLICGVGKSVRHDALACLMQLWEDPLTCDMTHSYGTRLIVMWCGCGCGRRARATWRIFMPAFVAGLLDN